MKLTQLSKEEKERWTHAEPWLKDALSNDENSSDEEMSARLIQEGSMAKEEAEQWVSKRSFYLNNVVMEDGSVYDPGAKKK